MRSSAVVTRLSAVLFSLIFTAACGPSEAVITHEGEDVSSSTFNELKLSGAHFNLNIIGVPKNKSADMTASSGRRIFVDLVGKTTINLSQGDFAVLDANGTDGTASFQLPNPDPDNDGTTTYSVYARALGKPGGSSTTTTCFTDATGETYCSVFSAVLVRTKGQQTFTNVSQELLYTYVDTDGDGKLERYPLFSDALASYYWSYDNAGLKLAQLRFYEVSTTVAAP
jgi:hypothetical protein